MRSKVRSVVAACVVPLWPVTIVGAAVGAAVGSAVLAPAVTYSATSVISIEVPIGINQLMTGMQPFSESLPDYLGGEFTYLNSEGFRRAVAAKLDQSSPASVIATRTGKTDLFTVVGTADSTEQARRVVDAAVTVYMDHVRQDNTNRYKAAVAAIDAVAPRIEQKLRKDGVVTPGPDLVALYSERAALQVQLERAPGVIVVEPTADQGAKKALPFGPLGGGAAGGVLAFGAAALWRSRRGILTSSTQVGDHAVPCPAVPLGKSDVDATIARSIYSVLPPPRTGRIVVVGVSALSETRAVAEYLSFAAAEHGPVKDVDLASDATIPSAADASDAAVVIDAGQWAASPAVTDVVDEADQIVVVARLGFDTRTSVAELCQAVAQRSAPFRVVCVEGRR